MIKPFANIPIIELNSVQSDLVIEEILNYLIRINIIKNENLIELYNDILIHDKRLYTFSNAAFPHCYNDLLTQNNIIFCIGLSNNGVQWKSKSNSNNIINFVFLMIKRNKNVHIQLHKLRQIGKFLDDYYNLLIFNNKLTANVENEYQKYFKLDQVKELLLNFNEENGE